MTVSLYTSAPRGPQYKHYQRIAGVQQRGFVCVQNYANVTRLCYAAMRNRRHAERAACRTLRLLPTKVNAGARGFRHRRRAEPPARPSCLSPP